MAGLPLFQKKHTNYFFLYSCTAKVNIVIKVNTYKLLVTQFQASGLNSFTIKANGK